VSVHINLALNILYIPVAELFYFGVSMCVRMSGGVDGCMDGSGSALSMSRGWMCVCVCLCVCMGV
jgi:hypothetical protein